MSEDSCGIQVKKVETVLFRRDGNCYLRAPCRSVTQCISMDCVQHETPMNLLKPLKKWAILASVVKQRGANPYKYVSI